MIGEAQAYGTAVLCVATLASRDTSRCWILGIQESHAQTLPAGPKFLLIVVLIEENTVSN